MSAIYDFHPPLGATLSASWYDACTRFPRPRGQTLPAFSVYAFWGAYAMEPLFMRAMRAYDRQCKTLSDRMSSQLVSEDPRVQWRKKMLWTIANIELRDAPFAQYMSTDERLFCALAASIAQDSEPQVGYPTPKLPPQVMLAAATVLSFHRGLGHPQVIDYACAGIVPFADVEQAVAKQPDLLSGLPGTNPYRDAILSGLTSQERDYLAVSARYNTSASYTPVKCIGPEDLPPKDAVRTSWREPSPEYRWNAHEYRSWLERQSEPEPDDYDVPDNNLE